MAESSPKEKKTLLEKEKLLVTSNFSFSYCVFNRLVQQTRKNQGLFEKELKELLESMDRCTGCHDITEILLKTALKNKQSINQPKSLDFFP